MSPKYRIPFFRLNIIIVCGILIFGCASSGIQTPTGEQATNLIDTFERGEARLNCGVSCSGAWGSARRRAKKLYDQGLWEDLAIEVARVGFKADQTYYYLGRSAEELGFHEGALKYYKLGLASSYKCDGIFNNCDGLVFPNEIHAGINRLPATDAVEARISNTSNVTKSTSQTDSAQSLAYSNEMSQELEAKRRQELDTKQRQELEAKKRQDREVKQRQELVTKQRQDREAIQRQELEAKQRQDREAIQRQELEAKQRQENEKAVRVSKNTALAKIRKANAQEKVLITNAISNNLFDAESARYRDIYLIPNSYACAEVNAKNRFGGYTGFQQIVAAFIDKDWFYVSSLKDNPVSCLDLITNMHMDSD